MVSIDIPSSKHSYDTNKNYNTEKESIFLNGKINILNDNRFYMPFRFKENNKYHLKSHSINNRIAFLGMASNTWNMWGNIDDCVCLGSINQMEK